jgi:hypothetical protein
MRSRFAAALLSALMVACAASCGGLEHPTSNDGADANNPAGRNPGTLILNVSVGKSILMVGDTTSITGSVGGVTISSNGLLVTSSSDTSVVYVGGPLILARAVGTATISVAYSGYQASPPLTVSVIPRTNR